MQQRRPHPPAWTGESTSPRLARILVGLILMLLLLAPLQVAAGPLNPVQDIVAGQQGPDWMSDETASRLAIDIPVLAPSYVPAPFGGEPETQAWSGFYSFYWLIPGAPPTYLRVTGEYGGVIPDFSYYDRNIQLQQNAEVRGFPAYHDVSPIYDVVYWAEGDVVYTVESHNLAADDSVSLANALVPVTPVALPAPTLAPEEQPGEQPGEQPAGNGNGSGQPGGNGAANNVQPAPSIAAPAAVPAGTVASIGMNGMSEAYLVTDGGYFLVTGDTGVVVVGGSSVDWQAPAVDTDTVVTFGLYELGTDRFLGSRETLVSGQAPVSQEITADVQCPAESTVNRLARVLVTGSGNLTIRATEGVWPSESPNTVFQPEADGGSELNGVLRDSAAALSWLAPDVPTVAYVSVTDIEGNLIDECSIKVVTVDVSGDLGLPSGVSNASSPGDGTGIQEADPEVVARIIANPIGFAGDATGGPEANGPDYGMPAATERRSGGASAAESQGGTADSTASPNSGLESRDLGPVTGANGMVAMPIGSSGGTLQCAAGATVVVPDGALTDEATVAIEPLADTEVPAVEGIDTVAGTAFDVTFSGPDGRAVEQLNIPATVTMALKAAPNGQGARIYRVDGATLKPMAVTDSSTGSVSTELTEYARLVVGVPTRQEAGGLGWISPILIGGLGLLALVSAGLLFSQGLARRKTRVVPVRRPAPGRVRYR